MVFRSSLGFWSLLREEDRRVLWKPGADVRGDALGVRHISCLARCKVGPRQPRGHSGERAVPAQADRPALLCGAA